MPAVEVDGLGKAYGSLKAVDGISFDVKQGEVFSLLGPNGAGKTTTIEILEGLRERDAGNVGVLGMDPWKKGYELHKRIGVIPQGFKFLDYPTPREAIRYYAALFGTKADPDELLKRVILEDAADIFFMKLSGGQKQKVGLALSLVNNPEMVFLDEPTTGLDPQARRAVWEVIRNLKKEGRSVLLTTHYLQEAEELADRVAIMNHGKIITSGTPSEIIAKHGSGERLTVKADRKLAEYIVANTKLKADHDGNETVTIHLEQKNDPMIALGAIGQSGIHWDTLSTKRDSLEDIFVRMVGEDINEQGELVRTK
ncbi:MAG: ABC transporter ATP-binding protein [Nitrososphaerales archaeon]|nr:ABC transporter ATP-binding protein [Nitrososphaerales archaeon]